MKENGEETSFQIPCMYNHKVPCIDCKLYSTNLDNIRKQARNKNFKKYFSRLIGEYPTPQQVSELLFNFDNKDGSINTETFGRMRIPSPLLSLGYGIAKERREYVIRKFEKFNIEEFAFGVHCPNYKKEEPANPTAQVSDGGE